MFPNEIGTVVPIREEDRELGWTGVKFPSPGVQNRFRIGHPDLQGGECDLEFANSEKVNGALVSIGNQLTEISLGDISVNPGDMLKLEQGTLRCVGIEKAIASGVIAFVSQRIPPDTVVVAVPGGPRSVYAGKFAGKLEDNARVILDATMSVIIDNLGLEDGSLSVGQDINVPWDAIEGQTEAKGKLQSALEGPLHNPAHYVYYKKEPPSGILLVGPPGCSKSMFGKAVYTSITAICRARGVNPAGGFILVNGPELLEKFVGVAEAKIRNIFARARKFKKTYSLPAVIFLDECEAWLGKREGGISSDVGRTIVPAFLAEMQGVRESGAIVLAATNKPWILDYAVVREGRFSEIIEVSRPDHDVAEKVFAKILTSLPISGATVVELAKVAADALFDPCKVIYKITRQDEESPINFTMANIANFGMMQVIIDRAKDYALDRDLKNPEPKDGITKEDLIAAVNERFRQNLILDHEEALRDFTKNFADKVSTVTKQRQVMS
jgi:ATP-dependent 26S proteasome regulatory subunit